jgi:molybdate/tungstate transport system substrate-binding protein
MRKLINRSIFILIIFTTGACINNTNKSTLTIFHAGSLSIPLNQIAKEFEKENPNSKILLEAAGSRKCARKITDLNKTCDLFASADYTVIDQLLIPEYADWHIKFAGNEMVIAMHPDAPELTRENWPKQLLDPQSRYGRSDPNSDPCGYRTVLSIKLAEQLYNLNGFADSILSKDEKYVRPKETDLLALIESRTIDYFFIYRSVAEQHNLKYLELPDKINLGKEEHKQFYANATVDVSGKKPGEFITKKGEPMIYALCIPNNSKNKELALQFAKFILEKEKGMHIIESNGQSSLVPSETRYYNEIPDQLKHFVLNK